jgi:hypothetical protein
VPVTGRLVEMLRPFLNVQSDASLVLVVAWRLGACSARSPTVCANAASKLHSLNRKQSFIRGDSFEKRRPLMEAWADYCDDRKGEVVELPPVLHYGTPRNRPPPRRRTTPA